MKRIAFCLALLLLVAFAVPAFSQVGKDLSGPHFNLNIIGVPKDKTVPSMTDTSRHTIFVPLQTNGETPRAIKINYIAGDSFQVLDGNATDDNEATIMVPHEDLGDLCYDVYAVGLGKPNGYAIVNASCAWDDTVTSGTTCQDALLLDQFTVERDKGKPKPQDISDVFRASGCIDTDGDLACDISFTNVWIFNIPQLLEYFWDYDNNGLKLMQVRFYPTTCGSVTVAP